MSTASTVKIHKKYWLTYQFFDVNGVNGSFRKPSKGAFKILIDIFMFFQMSMVSTAKKKKNFGFE